MLLSRRIQITSIQNLHSVSFSEVMWFHSEPELATVWVSICRQHDDRLPWRKIWQVRTGCQGSLQQSNVKICQAIPRKKPLFEETCLDMSVFFRGKWLKKSVTSGRTNPEWASQLCQNSKFLRSLQLLGWPRLRRENVLHRFGHQRSAKLISVVSNPKPSPKWRWLLSTINCWCTANIMTAKGVKQQAKGRHK